MTAPDAPDAVAEPRDDEPLEHLEWIARRLRRIIDDVQAAKRSGATDPASIYDAINALPGIVLDLEGATLTVGSHFEAYEDQATALLAARDQVQRLEGERDKAREDARHARSVASIYGHGEGAALERLSDAHLALDRIGVPRDGENDRELTLVERIGASARDREAQARREGVIKGLGIAKDVAEEVWDDPGINDYSPQFVCEALDDRARQLSEGGAV